MTLGLVDSNMVPVPVRCFKLWVNVTLGLLYFCAIWPHRWSHQSPTAATGWGPPLWLHQRQLHWRESHTCTHTVCGSNPYFQYWFMSKCLTDLFEHKRSSSKDLGNLWRTDICASFLPSRLCSHFLIWMNPFYICLTVNHSSIRASIHPSIYLSIALFWL